MNTQREVIIERPVGALEGMRVSWGGVWAGVLVALGTMLVLSTLGMAAARMSMVWDRPTALAQGALVWVVSLIAGQLLSVTGIGVMVSAALTYGLHNGTPGEPGRGSSAVAWLTFLAVILSLLATLAGAALGRRRAAARVTHEIE